MRVMCYMYVSCVTCACHACHACHVLHVRVMCVTCYMYVSCVTYVTCTCHACHVLHVRVMRVMCDLCVSCVTCVTCKLMEHVSVNKTLHFVQAKKAINKHQQVFCRIAQRRVFCSKAFPTGRYQLTTKRLLVSTTKAHFAEPQKIN